MRCLAQNVLLSSVFALTVFQPSFACAADQMVRRDWYFRESLRAIRDWEAILARWDKTVPEAQRIPVFPVPANGRPVRWPNPVPRILLPERDRTCRVSLHVAGDKVAVEHIGPNGKSAEQTASPGETVLGYKHPGGGGTLRYRDPVANYSSGWVYRHKRLFDRLTSFRPVPAPFALELDSPLDWRRGPNELTITLSNTTKQSLALDVQLQFHGPKGPRNCGQEAVVLAAGTTQSVRLPVELPAPGGGLLILQLDGAGGKFWSPLLTHVEDVQAVLESIGQILADTPDQTAGARLADLRSRSEKWRAADSARSSAAWRSLFEEASALRDKLLLGRIRFDTLLFVKRKPFFSEQPYMDCHHMHNRPGGGIYRLTPVCPAGKVTPVVDRLGEGIYRDLSLHWNADKMLFSFGNGCNNWDGKQSYHVYRADSDGTGIRQLTTGVKNDCEPFYLPNGQIGFTSDRAEHFVMCGSDIHAANLFVMNADGSDVRQLSFNVFNDFNPTVMPDGRILYSRWEYNERSVTSIHHPFTVNPDGTMMTTYYGNATIRPNVVMFPRPVPASNKIMALFTAHHGQTHGAIGLIDVRRGWDGMEPITVLTPNIPITGEKAEDSRYGWYSDPVPLSETTYLCSYTPTLVPWLEKTWALYVGDRHGNLALVYRDPRISCAEPVPLVRRPRPHILPPAAPPDTDATDAEATLAVADVYVGLPGVPRGTAKYLRILEDVPRKSVPRDGVILTSGTPIYTVKRIFGTVPIEPDGSAHFVVPANRNVYFEVLGADHREIQRMRSVVCLKPNERRTCIGCHEPHSMAPPGVTANAIRRQASRPTPPPWGTQILSFLRDVQPLLNAKCIRCHTHDRMANRVILTDDLTDQFTVGYEELLPYLSVANAERWDHPDDVHPRPPYTYGSKVSRLMELLDAGHHDVKLTEEDRQRLVNWIDANGVYYDRYQTTVYGAKRHIFTPSLKKTMDEVYNRRCTECHGSNDGRKDSWWLSLNRRDVKASRMLIAPLAGSAGGWQRCGRPVFAGTGDPDYQKLLGALSGLRDKLSQHPRADLLSLRGTAAERQAVVLPAPPPPAATNGDLAEGDWVYLSNLRWESASTGWSRNKDHLPCRDLDITNQPLRLGGRRYPKGVGTHAHSEIVYRLDGKYLRFFAMVGGAEAGGTVVFQVFGDDNKLFDSGVMQGLRRVKTVDVSTAGLRRLRLVVTDAGDGYNADMANWADARLLQAPTEPPK